MNSRWDNERVFVTSILGHLIQDSIEQTPGGCAFAAVTRQIEYDLRNTYFGVDSQESIQTGQLFDHTSWENFVRNTFENQAPTPIRLLHLAMSSGVPVLVPRVQEGLRHHIQVAGKITLEAAREKVLRAPLVGVFEIKSDYDKDGKAPYLGEGRNLKNEQDENVTHAVVLVGLARDRVTNEEYFIYQNSHGNPNQSLLRQNLSCVKINLIIEAYESFSTPPAAIVRDAQHLEHFLRLEKMGRQYRRQYAESLTQDPNRHVGVKWTQFHEPLPFTLLDEQPQPPPPQG